MRVEKLCRKCSTVKPTEQFYPRKIAKDGRASICISCLQKYARERYRDNPERMIARKKFLTFKRVLDESAS